MMNVSTPVFAASCGALLIAGNAAAVTVNFSDVDRFQINPPNAGIVASDGNDLLLVGDNSGGDVVFQVGALFDISGLTADVLAASTITYNIRRESSIGTGQDVEAFVFGNGADTSLDADDFSMGLSAGTITDSGSSQNGTLYTYNVTALVKALALTNGVVGVRLDSGLADSDGDGTTDAIRFYREGEYGPISDSGATTFLDITPAIPEPASLALLGLGTLCLLGRRRA